MRAETIELIKSKLVPTPFSAYYAGFKTEFKKSEFINYGRTRKESILLESGENKQKNGWFEILEEGSLTHLEGEKYPIRGVMPPDKVAELAKFKKIFPLFLKFLNGDNYGDTTFSKKNIFKKLSIGTSIILYKEFFINYIWWGLRDVYADYKCYSQPTRELYRIIKNNQVRDIACALIEYDTAYRYRFQDIMAEVNKTNFQKHPILEIKRLAELLFERERDKNWESGMGKFRKFMPLAYIYLFFDRKLLKAIKKFVDELNIDEVKLSPEDIYWTNTYPDYDFRGLSFAQRNKEYLEEKNSITPA